MKQAGKKKRNSRWLIGVILLLVAAAAGGAWYWQRNNDTASAAEEPVLQTARVRSGDITITASGSGNLIPNRELALGFRSGGVLAEAPVRVGEQVAAGQLLARLDDADARAQVAQAEANVALAEVKLAALTAGADPAAVAAAEASLAAAEADLARMREPATAARRGCETATCAVPRRSARRQRCGAYRRGAHVGDPRTAALYIRYVGGQIPQSPRLPRSRGGSQ